MNDKGFQFRAFLSDVRYSQDILSSNLFEDDEAEREKLNRQQHKYLKLKHPLHSKIEKRLQTVGKRMQRRENTSRGISGLS